MIGIARHTDYAVRLVLHLACLEEGARVSIGEIARQRQLPVAFVRRLVAPLMSAGILGSVRGAMGGVYLARPASEISLFDVVKVLEGGVALNHCVDNLAGCPLSAGCPVQVAWHGITRDLENSLKAVRFDRLAQESLGHAEAHQHAAIRRGPKGEE